MKTTLIILKPDAVQRGLMGQIISRFESKGLQMVGAKMMQISKDLAQQHYAVHQDRPFFEKLVAFMTSSPDSTGNSMEITILPFSLMERLR